MALDCRTQAGMGTTIPTTGHSWAAETFLATTRADPGPCRVLSVPLVAAASHRAHPRRHDPQSRRGARGNGGGSTARTSQPCWRSWRSTRTRLRSTCIAAARTATGGSRWCMGSMPHCLWKAWTSPSRSRKSTSGLDSGVGRSGAASRRLLPASAPPPYESHPTGTSRACASFARVSGVPARRPFSRSDR